MPQLEWGGETRTVGGGRPAGTTPQSEEAGPRQKTREWGNSPVSTRNSSPNPTHFIQSAHFTSPLLGDKVGIQQLLNEK